MSLFATVDYFFGLTPFSIFLVYSACDKFSVFIYPNVFLLKDIFTDKIIDLHNVFSVLPFPLASSVSSEKSALSSTLAPLKVNCLFLCRCF